MMKILIIIFVVFSTSLFAEVKIYDELSEDFYTGSPQYDGGGDWKKNQFLFRLDNQELFLERAGDYFKIHNKKNRCLKFGNIISIRKCKDSDEFLFNAIIIGQRAGMNWNGKYYPELAFILQQVNSDKYLGFKGNGPWNGYVKTKNTENAVVFHAKSDLPDFNPCENSKAVSNLINELKETSSKVASTPQSIEDVNEEIFYCSCPGFNENIFKTKYSSILSKIDNSKIFTTLHRNKIGIKENYCLVALQTYKKFSNSNLTNESEISTQVASTTKQNTKKTETKKTQTTKTQTNQTTNTIDADGYSNCILEHMKNVSSDEAAKAIKDACKSKYSSAIQKTITDSVEVSSNADYDFNNDSIGMINIPINLSACGSSTNTRFPIFTGC